MQTPTDSPTETATHLDAAGFEVLLDISDTYGLSLTRLLGEWREGQFKVDAINWHAPVITMRRSA